MGWLFVGVGSGFAVIPSLRGVVFGRVVFRGPLVVPWIALLAVRHLPSIAMVSHIGVGGVFLPPKGFVLLFCAGVLCILERDPVRRVLHYKG